MVVSTGGGVREDAGARKHKIGVAVEENPGGASRLESPAGPPPDLIADPPDPALVAALDPHEILRRGLLPWRRAGECTVVLTSRPEAFAAERDWLEDRLGPVRMARMAESALRPALLRCTGDSLARAAELAAPLGESCRRWPPRRFRPQLLAAGALLLGAALTAPQVTGLALVVLASLAMLWGTGLRLLALSSFGAPPAEAPHATTSIETPLAPIVTILVPLFRERAVSDALLKRLGRLDYPRELLDVCLVLEESDPVTRAALREVTLPSWVRTITVPRGTPQTKPRALNYALNFARGQIIGVYDAEDAPAPDQIARVVARFASAPPRTACLQGVLDYYNSESNWMARCFTLEYACWFRGILPAMARLGLVLPLGGTTFFLRRSAIEDLGGWDAHNVTEDADLGLRLARRGYRTELIGTVTEEEANARAWPWVRQRCRWLKGYAMTYAVHMRHPRRLWRDLGAWRFIGVQALFLGTLLQFALAPVLWSFWLVPLGLPHPLGGLLGPAGLTGLAAVFIGSEVVTLLLAIRAARQAGKPRLARWALLLQPYFALATLSVYKALAEAATRPFYWDKTAHGIFAPEGKPVSSGRPRPPRRASDE